MLCGECLLAVSPPVPGEKLVETGLRQVEQTLLALGPPAVEHAPQLLDR